MKTRRLKPLGLWYRTAKKPPEKGHKNRAAVVTNRLGITVNLRASFLVILGAKPRLRSSVTPVKEVRWTVAYKSIFRNEERRNSIGRYEAPAAISIVCFQRPSVF